MLPFVGIALGAGLFALLESLALLGLLDEKAAQLLCAALAFEMALACGRLGDRSRGGRAAVPCRLFCAWASCCLAVLGALYLPLGSALRWKSVLGTEKESLGAFFAGLSLLGAAPGLLAALRRPPRRRAGALLFLAALILTLLCGALLPLGGLLKLPDFVLNWAAPAGFLQLAAAAAAGAGFQRRRAGRRMGKSKASQNALDKKGLCDYNTSVKP